MNNLNENCIKNSRMFKLSEVLILLFITVLIGFVLGLSFFNLSLKKDVLTMEYSSDLSRFIENYNYIVDNYYGELNESELISNAIAGMVESLDDPYTMSIDDSSSNMFNTTLEGSFQGIGVEIVNDNENNIIVYSVINDSPAFKAGVQSMDIIKFLDGVSLEGVSTADFVRMIKNNDSNVFTLTVLRDDKLIDIRVTRELVTLRSVDSYLFEQSNKKIGYIAISVFANNTYQQFKEQLTSLENNNLDGLIIDVRNNTGGHLTSVEKIISLFLDSTHVIYQLEDKNGITKFYSLGKEDKTYQIVVLTNENSASASEILAGSLKDEYGAIVVGKNSYGKGTVQELKTLPDGMQYKFTTKKWLTPHGDWINEVGIKVNMEVELDPAYYDNPCYEKDNQLQEGINYIINVNKKKD